MDKRVTLTFDNGPTAEVTPQVLDCLARHDVKTTFFVIGQRAESAEGASLVRRAHVEGHWIGNHTYTHSTPLGELDRAAAIHELERTEEVLAPLRRSNRLFRPYGRAGQLGRHLLHPAVLERLQTGKYTCVLWNCIVGDWHDPEGWLDAAKAQCRSEPWSLVVLHDLPTGAMAHLDAFLHFLREEGVELRQDFPANCVPVLDGEIVLPVEGYVGEEKGTRL